MRLIVGLGNPGKEFENTRHNIGFQAIDTLADFFSVSLSKMKFHGCYGVFTFHEEKVILLKPQSYMNISGEVISAFVDYYKISIANLLIISDDLDLEVGKMKLKYKGSSGGHNGLKNIEKHLHTQEYKRLKIGISHNRLLDTKDYVLGKFSPEEKRKIEEVMKKIPLIFEDYMLSSFDKVMSKYNKK